MRISRLPTALLALAAACGAEADDRPVKWSYIYPAIVVPNCATEGCHSALSKNAGIDLSSMAIAKDTFRGYLNGGALLRGTARRPNDPTAYDYRMPPDQPLPDADIDLIDRWFAANLPD